METNKQTFEYANWKANGDERVRRIDGIYYHPETEVPHISVTNILDHTLAKPALQLWYCNQAVEAMIANPEWMDQGYDYAKAQAQAYIKEKSQQAKDRGTRVHGYVNSFFNDQVPACAPGDEGYYKAFLRFVEERQPRAMFTEMTLYDSVNRIAGTGDFLGYLADGDGRPEVLDFKSGGAYPESKYQSAAYRAMLIAEGIPVGGTRIIQLKDNGRFSDRIRSTAEEADADYEVFLAAKRIYVDRNRSKLTKLGYFTGEEVLGNE